MGYVGKQGKFENEMLGGGGGGGGLLAANRDYGNNIPFIRPDHFKAS